VDVGRIDLMQNFSFFECPQEYTEEILTGMEGVNYKSRQVHVEVAETRSEDGQTEERPVRERKPRREDKPRREEKPVREKKSNREEKPRREGKPTREERAYREEKTSRAPKRAPKVQVAQDDEFWRDFESGDWRQFFRSDNGKPKKKASAHKEKKSGRKEKVNGRKARRTR
jgi:ATP-dependent RNA helicase DeaD